jgi:hypothetical protein
MDCEKCGAAITEGADTCPECGEPVAAATDESDAFFAEGQPAPEADQEDASEPAVAGDGETPSEEAEDVPADEAAIEPGEEAPKKRKWWLVAVVSVLVAAVLAAGGFYLWTSGILGPLVGNDPQHAATRMLAAYANYDAQGILDNATHATLPPEGVAAFIKDAATAKTESAGKPMLKDTKIDKVTYDAKDPSKATVDITANWLVDPAKGDYQKQSKQLQMTKENTDVRLFGLTLWKAGKWLVVLYQ